MIRVARFGYVMQKQVESYGVSRRNDRQAV